MVYDSCHLPVSIFFFIPIKSFMHAAGLNFKCHNLRIKKLMTDHVNVLNLSVV